jgi:hypothetical protein
MKVLMELWLSLGRKLTTWVAAQFGLTAIATADVEAAIAKCDLLMVYARKSGALNHPKRLKARGRLIASAAAIKENLTEEGI